MSHNLPYSPAADMFLVGPRDDVTDLELAREEVSACALRIDELQRDLDTTRRTAAACAEIAGNAVRAAEAERDALKATLAELRECAVLVQDALDKHDMFSGSLLAQGLVARLLAGGVAAEGKAA